MLQVKLVDGEKYNKREVTIKQTTSFLWSIVDLLEATAKAYDEASLRVVGDDERGRWEQKSRDYRGMAGDIKRQLVDDINRQIDKSWNSRTNVSRETIDITTLNRGER